MGAFHLVKISGISGLAVNGTRFVGSSHWKIPRKSGKSKKVGPFSRLEFPNGISCSIYVSSSLYQFQVHGRAQRRTGIYDQMEQLFTGGKFHFCSHRNFWVFLPKWKAPNGYVKFGGILSGRFFNFCFISLASPDSKIDTTKKNCTYTAISRKVGG